MWPITLPKLKWLSNSGTKWDPKIPRTQRGSVLNVCFLPITTPLCLATSTFPAIFGTIWQRSRSHISDLFQQPKRQPWQGTGGEGAHITHCPRRQPVWSVQGDREKEAAATREPNSWISLAMLCPVLGWGGKNKKRLEQRVKWQKSLSGANGNKRVETREK